MPLTTTPSRRASAVLLGLALMLAVACGSIAASGRAGAADVGSLQHQIAAGRTRVSSLTGAARSAGARAAQLAGGVAALQARVDALQADLDAKRGRLLALRSQLRAARLHLTALQAVAARDQAVLSAQLVGSYESPRPDLVTVVLDANGFNDLLNRLSFAQRIGDHDARIVAQVRTARRAVAAQATLLGQLSVRQQRLTEQVLEERNNVDRSRIALLSREIAAARTRDALAGRLDAARRSVGELRAQLARVEAAAASAAAAASSRASGSSAASGAAGSSGTSAGSSGGSAGGGSGSSGASGQPEPASSGGFTFPLPKSAVSPPGTWSLDDGVDMSAPGGTPEYAVCSGTIVLHGIGGFGPSAPVLHCDSPIDGYGYVYYGHAGPGNWVPVGTHVSAGQVISEIGYGIVGISTGPHVEMGFADSSGSPIGPSSAPAMSSLLHAAYGG